MSATIEFVWEESPEDKPGWYATLHCWDIAEGIFSGAHYWSGTKWDSELPITAHAGPFPTKAEAESWSDANDPELPKP
jgi:hypothetical protein